MQAHNAFLEHMAAYTVMHMAAHTVMHMGAHTAMHMEVHTMFALWEDEKDEKEV
jgi:hypothetical protein